MRRSSTLRRAGIIVVFVVALAVPAIAPDPATTNIAVFTMMYIGLATAWNPIGLLANAGVDVLVNSVIFFGGGYLFGIAFRPVVVEARAFETTQGYPVWQSVEGAFYAWSTLKQLPESERDKKESQLRINLGRAIEGLAESLNTERFTVLLMEAAPGEAQP